MKCYLIKYILTNVRVKKNSLIRSHFEAIGFFLILYNICDVLILGESCGFV